MFCNTVSLHSVKRIRSLRCNVSGLECSLEMFSRISFTFIAVIISCYEWLLCWLTIATSRQMKTATEKGLNKFEARNNAQVYKARDLSRAFAEFFALKNFQRRISEPDATGRLSSILNLIGLAYGLWSLEKHLPTFYQGCFASGADFADELRSELLKICGEMKGSAVAVADSLAPPDFVLNSVIAKSDGLVSFEY